MSQSSNTMTSLWTCFDLKTTTTLNPTNHLYEQQMTDASKKTGSEGIERESCELLCWFVHESHDAGGLKEHKPQLNLYLFPGFSSFHCESTTGCGEVVSELRSEMCSLMAVQYEASSRLGLCKDEPAAQGAPCRPQLIIQRLPMMLVILSLTLPGPPVSLPSASTLF